ncbi:isoprenylcysteine carboxylmethyltransferase family protein [Aestuariibius sp. HNIBRBA575]|uniref:methyltransferase family protein n=1 Tax=Aestuariibius sp. HNIBRBA575 TaxID=3233343 RepID=UPI0034A58231
MTSFAKMPISKWIDVPPVWLAGAICVAWFVGQAQLFRLSFGGAWSDFLGGIAIGGGVILILLAFVEMRKMRTTVIPHQEAARLVTSGIFKRTRNPIYLGDVLILLGVILRWDAVAALPLVPVFLWWIERRFVIPEERGLRTKFGKVFFQYSEKTRRWV